MWTLLNWKYVYMALSVITVTDIDFLKPGVLDIRKLRRSCNDLVALALNRRGRDVKQIFLEI
jgi:hypothetical protein